MWAYTISKMHPDFQVIQIYIQVHLYNKYVLYTQLNILCWQTIHQEIELMNKRELNFWQSC